MTIYSNDAQALTELGPSRQDFEAWLVEIDAEHQRRGSPYGDGPLASTTGVACWVEFFKEGYSPVGALDEDATNW